MLPKLLAKSDADKGEPGSSTDTWLNWCRLCAKREDNDQENSSIFVKNESGIPESELTTSIGKYFWVNIKSDDKISKRLCYECRKLVEELISFTERVNKVQTMYVLLQNIKPATTDGANKLRSQCGLIDEGWEHIIKPEKPKEVEKPKPLQKHQEAQTDLMIFFNDSSGENNVSSKPASIDNENIRQEIMEDLNNQLQSDDDDDEQLLTEEVETEVNYEYILQDDIELMDCQDMSEQDTKSKIIKVTQDVEEEKAQFVDECDEEEQNQDKEIHKEFKTEDDEDKQLTKKFKFSTEQEEIELEYQDSEENLNTHDIDQMEEEEEAFQEIDEYEDDEDYVNVSDSTQTIEENQTFSVIPNQKRGRPILADKKSSTMSEYSYECKDCKRKYKNPNVYRKHMLNVHNVITENITNFRCSLCKKDFLTESRLRSHMRQHLPEEEKLNVPCPYCNRKFSQIGAMRQHVNGIHHQMKPFICDQCGRACKTMAALTEHQLVHTNECPFECEVCHKRFKNKPRLKSHMDMHSKALYPCPDCDIKLNTRRTLLQHRLVHSDVKRFKCEFCDAAFKRSKALKNHLILHSGLRPYKCNFCDRAFSNGSNCRAHKKRTHPAELAEEEANGKVAERVAVPKMEELKSAKGVLVQPRKIKRNGGGLPEHLRKLLIAAEQHKLQTSEEYEEDDPAMENLDYSDMHYEIGETEMGEEGLEEVDAQDIGAEECEETVIYEIIDEI